MSLLEESRQFNQLIKSIDFENFESAKVLISGGTGLIGGYLAAVLAIGAQEQGVHLRGPITLTGSRSHHFLNNLLDANLVKIISLRSISERPPHEHFTHTFHAASPASPDSFSDLESLTFLNSGIIPQLMQVTSKSFVFFSTGEVYGTNAPKGVKESFQGQITQLSARVGYPNSKLKGEEFIRETYSRFECTSIIARLFHTFGPGISPNDTRTFSSFLYQALHAGEITMHSLGEQIRSFLHLSDTSKALILLSKNEASSTCETFNIGSTLPLSIGEFANLIATKTNSKVTRNSQANFSLSPNQILLPNTDRLEKLGWSQSVSIADTLDDTINWMKLPVEKQQF
jgi:nucleoside-diphosphate-sugar epimerase